MTSEVGRKVQALIKLGIARQSPQDDASQIVYVEGLESVPSDIVERACSQLAREPKNDYEPAFPSLGALIQRCREVRDHDDMASAPKQLREARPEPLSKEEAKAWVEKLKAEVQRRRQATESRSHMRIVR